MHNTKNRFLPLSETLPFTWAGVFTSFCKGTNKAGSFSFRSVCEMNSYTMKHRRVPPVRLHHSYESFSWFLPDARKVNMDVSQIHSKGKSLSCNKSIWRVSRYLLSLQALLFLLLEVFFSFYPLFLCFLSGFGFGLLSLAKTQIKLHYP